MTMMAITPASFPTLNAIFVRPSLLEARLSNESLNDVIPVKDVEEIARLKGRKSEKIAKRWAPLLVHNLLHDEAQFAEDPSLLAVLSEAEKQLSSAVATQWASAFRDASLAGVPPTQWISRLPNASKRMLNVEQKHWQGIAQRVEAGLANWIVGEADRLKEYLEGLPAEREHASLKKLAKFVPRAS